FDMAYPYEKLDSVALPSFFGAMEHPGLVTYSSTILLSTPEQASLWFKRRHGMVVAHELAHQWFGNLVTLDWWDDIWLNESFATWMAHKMVAAWKPEWSVDAHVVTGTDGAMKHDSLVAARSIRRTIETSEDLVGIFDAISYSKGAA